MRFTGKTAVVTGGANGIGRCIAESFLDAGAVAAVIDKDEEAGRRLAARYGGRMFFYPGDIARKPDLDGFVSALLERFGQIHFLINNAMKSMGGILSGCDWEDF